MTPNGRPMRVLAVVDSTAAGGAERSLASLAPLLVAHGVDVEVAYFHDRGGIKEQLTDRGVPLIHVPLGRSRIRAVWRLRAVIRHRRPDLVHTMVFEADVIGRTAAWLARVPVVSSIIGEMYGLEQFALVPSRRRLKMAWLTDIATARLAIRFHAVTNALATVMVPRLRIDDRRVEVIYRGRDPAEFTPVTPARRHDIRHRLGIDDSMLLVIAVARHEPVKNLESLIRAAPQIIGTLPSCRVMIAGRTGESTALLERLIRNDGLEAHVMLLGERSDVADLLAAADALVCPSLREGIGGSVLEALASGCPIACSDLASLREVTVCAAAECDEPRFDAPHMHLARFFPPTDIEALAEQVIACLAEGRTELGDSRRRRHFERNFDADAVAAQMVEFYRRALGSPG